MSFHFFILSFFTLSYTHFYILSLLILLSFLSTLANKAEAKIDDDDFKNEIEIEAEQVKRNEGLMPSVTNNSNENNKIIT